MRVHDIRMIPRLIGQCHSELTPPVQGNPTQSCKVDSNLDSVNTRPGGEPDLLTTARMLNSWQLNVNVAWTGFSTVDW